MRSRLRWPRATAALVLLLVGSCLGAALSSRPAPEPPPGQRANIILLSVDSLRRASFRPDRLPVMNALAAGSVVFDNAVSPSSWTLPSHASLMTGLYPDRHGAVDRRLRMGTEYPTLSLLLWEAGYETVGFTDKGFLDRRFGMGRGYERYDDWTVRRDPGLEAVLPRAGDATGTPGSDRFDRALAFLRQRRSPERPFFLFLHTFGVHDYFYAH
ncbi:MAG TPA: sulfatase-like hydrolase/transferase, partial [Thermoanaerobaculia bacterium]|nr:sulfatase-like hydrolase/transferase [Thermoanaerobaculia bacterium]